MKIIKEGDKVQMLCHTCGRVDATHQLRDVPFSDQSGLVKNLLVAVCDSCQQVLAVPAQSAAQVTLAYKKVRLPLEVRVPAHYLDMLYLAMQKIDPTLDEHFSRALILYYVHALASGRYPCDDLAECLTTENAKARASRRVSMKINQNQLDDLTRLAQAQGLPNNGDVVKAVILRIFRDLVQCSQPVNLTELRNLAAAFS